MVNFKAKMGIGLKGATVLVMDAEVAKGYKPYSEKWSAKDAIFEDIDDLGITEWYEYLPGGKPVISGIYEMTGSVQFTEDSCDYSNIEFKEVQLFN